jgi:CO/xanthine dehydrogenase FAD-binding subunit
VRAFLPNYAFEAPATLQHALDRLAQEPGRWRPFAGGTDLMVLLESGKLPPGGYLSLWHLDQLRGVRRGSDEGQTGVRPPSDPRLTPSLVVGALTTYTDVLNSDVLHAEFPLLCRAAAETGGVATQNRGTIGGNIANASPAADTPPALLVYDAQLELVSARGTRTIDYAAFHTGYKQMDLKPDELIGAVRLARGARDGWTQYYRKVGTRRAQAISKVCLAAAAHVDDGVVRDIRIAVGSVAPTVVRARAAERALVSRSLDDAVCAAAARILADEIAPIDDLRSTALYRRRVASNLLLEFLRTLRGRR